MSRGSLILPPSFPRHAMWLMIHQVMERQKVTCCKQWLRGLVCIAWLCCQRGALIQSGPLRNFAAKLFILESVFCRSSQPNMQDYLPFSASMFSAVSLSLSLCKLPFFRWKGRWKGTGVGGCCVFVRCKWRAGSLTLFLRGVCRGFLGTAPGKGRWIKCCSILSPPQQHRDGFLQSLPKQDVSTNLTKRHLNKRAEAPLVNRDTTGCFAVSMITYCSVAWCLLPLHPFEYILLWKDDSGCCRQKKPFPSVYLPNKDWVGVWAEWKLTCFYHLSAIFQVILFLLKRARDCLFWKRHRLGTGERTVVENT